MPTLPPIPNATYTINGLARSLIDGMTLYFGDVVTFNGAIGKRDLLPVNVWGDKVKTRAVAWLAQAWTVTAADGVCNRLLVQQRRAGVTIAQTQVTINVVARPVAQPTNPTSTDSDPIPTTPGSETGTPATPRLTGFMRLGLVDAARVTCDELWPHVGTWCKSIRVWHDPKGFKRVARDNEAANALTYQRAGCDVTWCIASDDGALGGEANAPAYAVTFFRDWFDLCDAPDSKAAGCRGTVEIWNEPDLLDADGKPEYWTGTVEQYAAMAGKTAKALKAVFGPRIRTMLAGMSWSIGYLKRVIAELIRLDLLKFINTFTFHGYPAEVDDSSMRPYVEFAGLCKLHGKGGMITEGSPGFGKAVKSGRKQIADWVKAWPQYAIALEKIGQDAGVVDWQLQVFNAFDIHTTNSAGAFFTLSGQTVTPTACLKSFVTAIK